MNLIITNQQAPEELLREPNEVWTYKDLEHGVASEEGLSLPDDAHLWFDTKDLSFNIYEGFRQYAEYYEISYYRLAGQEESHINIAEGVTVFGQEEDDEEDLSAMLDAAEEELGDWDDDEEDDEEDEQPSRTKVAGISIAAGNSDEQHQDEVFVSNVHAMLNYDDLTAFAPEDKKTLSKPGRSILFGSAKGGVGKTFTCIMTARRYAEMHPTERVALADFDIMDGQVGININKIAPTLADYYSVYKKGQTDFSMLQANRVKSEHFPRNLDFYLAPPFGYENLTNDMNYWAHVVEQLLLHYDVVFFDSGTEYLKEPSIAMLYKAVDKVVLAANPSINAVKSVIRQANALTGNTKNSVYSPKDKIGSKINIYLTRVTCGEGLLEMVIDNLSQYANVVAAFGDIDELVLACQWYQQWDLVSNSADICEYLDVLWSEEL